ncbi:MAG: hybrid sensor histidine kinase/response regulator [Xanthomonadales bacterium]|nr:hybrid sensor histidine kinase/response regulator [Xanthomonadales bacterium]
MKRVSRRAAHYIRDELLKSERFIVIALDAGQKILSVNQSTPDWKLPGMIRGSMLPDSLGSLLDAAVGATDLTVFSYVELNGFFVDIHVLCDKGSTDLVIHDVTQTHVIEQTLQQRAHENSLLSEQRAALNSELEDLNQELLLRRRQAEKASAAKSQFIASMSHEFRSPITAIMGYANLLQTELPGSDNPQALQRASWHLLTLVENLLEQAREGDEHVKLNPTRFSLDRLVADIDALFRAQADVKGLDFEVKSSPGGIDVKCDELRLRQILINLVSNALRYTLKGQVSVHFKHRDDKLNIRVCDSGQGIAAADLERVFEPFTRIGGDNAPGAGLGLTITRQLLQRMDGQLKIDSKPGVGSEFRVDIPCLRIRDDHNEMPALSGTLLWVDDDLDILSLYRVVLENWGLHVLTASSVAQAKDRMKHHDCPLVITDMHLTDGDGLELFSALRTEHPAIEGIIVSGSGIVDLSAEIAGSGIRAFLQKPIDAEVLYKEVAAVFTGGSPGPII